MASDLILSFLDSQYTVASYNVALVDVANHWVVVQGLFQLSNLGSIRPFGLRSRFWFSASTVLA